MIYDLEYRYWKVRRWLYSHDVHHSTPAQLKVLFSKNNFFQKHEKKTQEHKEVCPKFFQEMNRIYFRNMTRKHPCDQKIKNKKNFKKVSLNEKVQVLEFSSYPKFWQDQDPEKQQRYGTIYAGLPHKEPLKE